MNEKTHVVPLLFCTVQRIFLRWETILFFMHSLALSAFVGSSPDFVVRQHIHDIPHLRSLAISVRLQRHPSGSQDSFSCVAKDASPKRSGAALDTLHVAKTPCANSPFEAPRQPEHCTRFCCWHFETALQMIRPASQGCLSITHAPQRDADPAACVRKSRPALPDNS